MQRGIHPSNCEYVIRTEARHADRPAVHGLATLRTEEGGHRLLLLVGVCTIDTFLVAVAERDQEGHGGGPGGGVSEG